MLDFEKVKGYTKLTEEQKLDLKHTYTKHMDCLGEAIKKDYKVKSVEVGKGYLKVMFVGANWMHYKRGTWW